MAMGTSHWKSSATRPGRHSDNDTLKLNWYKQPVNKVLIIKKTMFFVESILPHLLAKKTHEWCGISICLSVHFQMFLSKHKLLRMSAQDHSKSEGVWRWIIKSLFREMKPDMVYILF